MMTIGVLALQGDFAKHIEMLIQLGVHTVEVRKPEDLDKCDGLIIPGGESTVIFRQMNFIKLTEKLLEFGSKKPIFGTCAGLILMSSEIISSPMKPFGFLDVQVERNAFGRQVESFKTNVQVHLNAKKQTASFPAYFIRAPKIKSCDSAVEILAEYDGEPILVKQGYHLGASFHPELTTDTSIHRYFLSLVQKSL